MFSVKDIAVGGASILLGIFIFLQSRDLVAKTSLDPAGPAALPLMMAWVLVILGAIEVLGGLYAKKKTKSDKPVTSLIQKLQAFYVHYKLVLRVMLIGAIFCVLLDFLGYLIAVPLLFAAILWVMGRKDLKALLVINLITTAVLFVAFRFVLSVDLPLGPFAGLF